VAPQRIATDGAPRPAAPFEQGVAAGSLVFVSGQLGLDPQTNELPADVGEETRRLLRNLQAVVEAGGLALHDVVKTTVFLVDLDDYAAVNEVYATFFPGVRPARSTVKVAGLLAGARVEIEAIAARPT
jgi:2-iminobutanoate/2-iminopropanoate deaminase